MSVHKYKSRQKRVVSAGGKNTLAITEKRSCEDITLHLCPNPNISMSFTVFPVTEVSCSAPLEIRGVGVS